MGEYKTELMVCFHAMDKHKHYLIPLDLHWTHSNNVAFGLADDDQHNRQAAVSFLDKMQKAVVTYQSSTSVFKYTGPTGFTVLGGRMSVLFTYLRLQGEKPPAVVTIDQTSGVLRREMATIDSEGQPSKDEFEASVRPQASPTRRERVQ